MSDLKVPTYGLSWCMMPTTFCDLTMTDDTQDTPLLQEPRLWQDELWTAKVIKNEDDDGWAVAMYKAGESEPALVGPWTMGRDKKTPKPLDGSAFITLVKTASEFVRRSEQQLHAQLNQSVTVNGQNGRVTVLLRIVPDEDNPYAVLTAQDDGGETLAGRFQAQPPDGASLGGRRLDQARQRAALKRST
jgi:hypothetical protein